MCWLDLFELKALLLPWVVVFCLSDLKNYKSIWRTPIRGTYKGYEVHSMPIPSSGGIHMVQMLNILEHLKLDSSSPFKVDNIHKTVFSMQAAFEDRALYLGDVPNLPIRGITSKTYAKKIASKFKTCLLYTSPSPRDRG